MAFFVVVRLQIRPERLPAVLALIRTEFARPHGSGLGRRRGHVFRRLGTATELLSCIEWDSQYAYEQYRQSATHRAILDSLAAPSYAQYCTRPQFFERMLERFDVAACAVITSSGDDAIGVEQYVLQELRAEVVAAPGLVAYEVYRSIKTPARYLAVHRWRHLADLEHFRRSTGLRQEQRLAEIGAAPEWFTGELAAQYPAPDELST